VKGKTLSQKSLTKWLDGSAVAWVHTLIANAKGNIRCVYHGVSSKHLGRYFAEFCYWFNRLFWESQMLDRILTACLNSSTISFVELKV
jgi:hypothetical protein